MKIKYILLENFLGIYAGTGRTKLEIDFSKNKNKIIILNAANGKGKTTLLSLMHPLRSSYDDRSKNLIIPDELGHKICIIEYNGNEYKCEHFYGKKNKSFISKNGKELNENGNIKSFENIIKDELGIDSEYFKIGKIGSNVSNFIDLKTAERKKYINHFIPSIDDYLTAYENVKTHYMNMNAEIKVIKNNIEKYSNLQELDEIENSLNKLIEEKQRYENESLKISTNLNILNEKYNDYKKKINELIKIVNQKYDISYIETEDDLKDLSILLDDLSYELQENYHKTIIVVEEFLNKYNISYENIDEELYEKIKTIKIRSNEYYNTNNSRLDELKIKEAKMKNEFIEINNQRNYYEEKINSISDKLSDEEIEDLNQTLSMDENEMKMYENEINKYEKNYDKDIIIDNLNFFKDKSKIDSLLSIFSSIHSYKEIYTSKTIDDCYKIIMTKKKELSDNKYLTIDEFIDFIKIENDKKEYDNLYEKKQKLVVSLIDLNNKKEISDKTLKDRPKNCKIDNCNFIKLSVSYAEEVKSIDEKNKELEEITEKMKNIEEIIKTKDSYISFYKDFLNVKNKIEKYCSKYFYNEIINNDILEKSFINTINIEKEIKLDKFIDYMTYLKNYDNLNASYNEIQTKIKNSSLIDKLYEEYEDQINKYIKRYDEVLRLYNENTALIDIGKEAIKKNKMKIQICEEFEKFYKKYKDDKNEYETFDKYYMEFYNIINDIKDFKFNNDINGKNETLNIIKKSIKSSEEKIQNLKTSIQIIKDNMKQLKEIEVNFNLVNDLKNALDPKKGIPIIFANEYLKNISTKTNKLLEIAYGEHFKIRFNVTASDFLVEVYKGDGTFLDDINMASQGETSLTNVSLSLAMLECMIDKYNILYLDEIDSTLSTENRKLFIELLEKQIDNLNIDQCFIITHNNEFYNKDVDLILLEGHDCDLEDPNFIQGKNVLLNLD